MARYSMDDFNKRIAPIQKALKERETDEAYRLISLAMSGNMSAAEPHNLLGIYYELTGDDDAARNHYRAAYALDATYTPSCKNLSRVCGFYLGVKPRNFDYGENPESDRTTDEKNRRDKRVK